MALKYIKLEENEMLLKTVFAENFYGSRVAWDQEIAIVFNPSVVSPMFPLGEYTVKQAYLFNGDEQPTEFTPRPFANYEEALANYNERIRTTL